MNACTWKSMRSFSSTIAEMILRQRLIKFSELWVVQPNIPKLKSSILQTSGKGSDHFKISSGQSMLQFSKRLRMS